jgi:hypothetical protein
MWASDMLYLNDATEMLYGRRLIGEALLTYNRSATTERSLVVAAHAPGTLAFTACVLCFSEGADDLSQWRAYARDGGYSVGLTARALRILATGSRLRSVIYDRATQKRVARECAEMLRKRLASISKRDWSHDRLVYEAAHFGILVNLASIRLKDPCFAAEREWRVIALASGPKLKFRVRGKALIPYCELPFDSGGVVQRGMSVVVAPSDQPALAKHAAAGLMAAMGGGRRVTSSSIPYRDW